MKDFCWRPGLDNSPLNAYSKAVQKLAGGWGSATSYGIPIEKQISYKGILLEAGTRPVLI
eukprot:1202643-Pyramimonas_sp.AAC.1